MPANAEVLRAALQGLNTIGEHGEALEPLAAAQMSVQNLESKLTGSYAKQIRWLPH